MNNKSRSLLPITLLAATMSLYSGCYQESGIAYSNAKKAYACAQEGDLDKAIEYCSKSISANPGYSYPYELRSSCYLQKGSNTLAITDCNTVISLTPDRSETYILRARIYCSSGNYSNALADCNKAISIDSGTAYTHGLRGWILKEQNLFEDSITDISTAIKLDPHNPDFYLWRSESYAALNRDKEAQSDIKTAEKLNAGTEKTYIVAAINATNKGDYKNALAILDKFLESSPDSAWGINAKAYIFATANDPLYRNGSEAVKLAEKAVKLIPAVNRANAKDTLACAYAEIGDFDKAIKLQQEVILQLNTKGTKARLESFKNKTPWREPIIK